MRVFEEAVGVEREARLGTGRSWRVEEEEVRGVEEEGFFWFLWRFVHDEDDDVERRSLSVFWAYPLSERSIAWDSGEIRSM